MLLYIIYSIYPLPKAIILDTYPVTATYRRFKVGPLGVSLFQSGSIKDHGAIVAMAFRFNEREFLTIFNAYIHPKSHLFNFLFLNTFATETNSRRLDINFWEQSYRSSLHSGLPILKSV